MINNSFLDFKGKSFLQLGILDIRWYAICILTGVLFAWILGKREARKLGIRPSLILDGLIFCVPLAIVGARIYYIIFDENKAVNFPTFGSYFDIRNGGLAIMGGVIMAIIFVIIYCRKRKMSLLSVFDLLAPGFLIGQAFGRWGNWFNGEAHGGIMSDGIANFYNKVIPWIMKKMSVNYCNDGYGSETTYYHPTFLYESLWNVLGLIIILVTRRKFKKVRVGDYLPFYMIWYGVGRSVLIEPFRTDQLQKVLGVPVNILIPAVMAVIGLVWLILKHTVSKLKTKYYHELVEEVKESKPDTITFKMENVIIHFGNVIREAYYYTFKDLKDTELDASTIDSYMKKDYKNVLQTKEEIDYFNQYIINHLAECKVTGRTKKLFRIMFVKGFKILVYSRYSKELLEACLEHAKIKTYVSVYQEDVLDSSALVDVYNNVKKNLYLSDNLHELRSNKNQKVVKCYCPETKVKEMTSGVDYMVTSFDDVRELLLI